MAISNNKEAFDFSASSFKNSDLKSLFSELARAIGSDNRAEHSHNHQHHASVETQSGVEANHSLTSGSGCHTTDAATVTDATTTTTTTTAPAGDTAVDTSATANSGTTDAVPGGTTTTASASASDTTDAGTTTASASGSTDAAATTQQNEATHVSATGTTPDATDAGKTAADTTTTVSSSDGSVGHSSTAADSGQHLCDNAFAFPAQGTSANASTLDAVSHQISQAGGTDSLQGLGDDISGFAQELQAYVADHHLTAADAQKFVDAVHATIATSLDLHI